MGQGREPRPADIFGIRHQPPHQRPDRIGAEEHGLAEPAGMQQPGGKDMAALAVGAELDLVDREKLDRAVERHRFNGADEIGRVRRQDLLLAGDQRNRARAAQLHHPIVILQRQEPQREPDHAGLVIEHALDREMGFAGIGRPEDRDEPRRGTEHGHATWYRVSMAAGQEVNRPGKHRATYRSA